MTAVHLLPIPISHQGTANVPLDALSQRVVQAARSRCSLFGHSALQRELTHLNPHELKRLLDACVSEISPKEVDALAKVIPLEALEKAVRTQYPLHVNALQTAKEMFHEAKYYLETTKSQVSPTLRTRLAAIFDSFIAILESILKAFGIADFFKASESALESEFKGQKIMMLVSLFSMMSTLLLSLIGAELAALSLGGTLLGIAALSLIYPHFKPASAKLPRAENWSQQFREGNLFAAEGRKGTLDDIARTLVASKNAKTHVMLIGKTGIGKTETVKSFVQAVERGDYPELKGKTIHYINTAELLSSTEMFSNSNKILSQISDAMGRHRENYILIFDEIHIACQKTKDMMLSEQLKTMLDQGKENFPYVVGITTEEEYFREIYVNNAAFARRFKRISIENTEPQETLKILNNALLKKAPKAIVEQGALQALLQKTQAAFGQEAAQPAVSLKILSQCIKQISDSQKTPLETRVDQLRERIRGLYSQGAVGQGNGLLPYGRASEAPQLEEELRRLEIVLAREKEELAQLYQHRDQLSAVKTAAFQTVLKTANIASAALSTKHKHQLGAFLLQSHFMAPALEAKIRARATQHGINVVINPALIDEVIARELENDRRAQEAVQRGREQIAARGA